MFSLHYDICHGHFIFVMWMIIPRRYIDYTCRNIEMGIWSVWFDNIP